MVTLDFSKCKTPEDVRKVYENSPVLDPPKWLREWHENYTTKEREGTD